MVIFVEGLHPSLVDVALSGLNAGIVVSTSSTPHNHFLYKSKSPSLLPTFNKTLIAGLTRNLSKQGNCEITEGRFDVQFLLPSFYSINPDT